MHREFYQQHKCYYYRIISKIINSLMYSREKVGPKIEPWKKKKKALVAYFSEDFLSRTTQNLLLLRYEETVSNTWPEIPYDLRFGGRLVCRILSKAPNIPNTAVRLPFSLNCLNIWYQFSSLESFFKIKKSSPFWRCSRCVFQNEFLKHLYNIIK